MSKDIFLILFVAGLVSFLHFRKEDKKKENISIIVLLVSFILYIISTLY